MSVEAKIPIVVGVTGHRRIREQDHSVIFEAVKTELRKLQEQCPHSSLVMLSSLAEGGDLLCADAAETLGISLIAALPRPLEDYEKDFSEEAKLRLLHHCARAEQVFVAPHTEALPERSTLRDFQFRQAGIYVASHSHVLLALWDGGPGTATACGTADAVDFVLSGSYLPRSGIPLRSGSNETVIHLFTPRAEHNEKAAGTVHVLGDRDAVSEILRRTDGFNLQAEKVRADAASRLPEGASDDPCLMRQEKIGRIAGKLSRVSAKRFRRVLALLAVASSLLTFAFLMYDSAHAIWMILVCGFMLLAAWLFHRYAVRSDCHRCYIEYRALAECLRVQTYLRYAGSCLQVADLLTWTQQKETSWIMAALCALGIGPEPLVPHNIQDCWVETQWEYHREAATRSHRNLTVSDRTVQTALILSVMLYMSAVLFELFFGGLLLQPLVPLQDVESIRTVLKISLGTLSAMTLFVSNFYGRLSLPRTLSDHRKMAQFYTKISARLEQYGQTEELLTVLAREELIENGNWCSYQRDNKPDVSF